MISIEFNQGKNAKRDRREGQWTSRGNYKF